jgi:hypothetical protein
MPNLFADKNANAKTDLDAILSGDIAMEGASAPIKNTKNLVEAIKSEQDLLSKLVPLSEVDIFKFMKNLHGGSFFNLGLFTSIPVAGRYKSTYRIYKVVNMTAIVSGVSYENVGTTKDFRDQTGQGPGKSFYDHVPGYENKVGVHKSNPNSKYILWDVKASSGNWYAYYLADIDTGAILPISAKSLESSVVLTPSEKERLQPKAVTGYDVSTGALVTNKTVWRTTKFEHVFWLSQNGYELGAKFEESLTGVSSSENLEEATGEATFRDLHADVHTDLDTILSGDMAESVSNATNEDYSHLEPFECEHCGKTLYGDDYRMLYSAENDYDEVVCHDCYNKASVNESKKLKESYRRTVSRGNSLADNDFFVDFE